MSRDGLVPKVPEILLDGNIKGLLAWPAPVWHLVWESGWSMGPQDEPDRILAVFPRGIFPAVPMKDVDVDLTQEAGVARALFWLGDMLGEEDDDDRRHRSNPPDFGWDTDEGCWYFGEGGQSNYVFGTKDCVFLQDCEHEDGPITPSRFVNKLVEPDFNDPWWWHKGLVILVEHVAASGIVCPERPAHGS